MRRSDADADNQCNADADANANPDAVVSFLISFISLTSPRPVIQPMSSPSMPIIVSFPYFFSQHKCASFSTIQSCLRTFFDNWL